MFKKPRMKFLAVLALTLFTPMGFADLGPLHILVPSADDDEAMIALHKGLMNQSEVDALFRGASEDYFADMDYGITKNKEELRKRLEPYVPGITADEAVERVARGRDNWLVFSGGNDRFWDALDRATLGGFDLLKIVSDHPALPSTRKNRWKLAGLVNEPCFKAATGPDAKRWGLWLPTRDSSCPQDPFENQQKYPGVKIGARALTTPLKWRGQEIPIDVGSSYGYASGVVGLRLFPNPEFDQKAADKWNPEKYYTDPAYYYDPNLVRPYRVGMACAFCHVGPNPTNPPKKLTPDGGFSEFKWENLNSNPGAQYFWTDRIFDWDWAKNQNNFVVQLLKTYRPGTIDTSLVSSDMINNPRTMNAVYDLPARVKAAADFNHLEQLKGDELGNAQFSLLDEKAIPRTSKLRGLYATSKGQVLSPRVLKDGSDSVGALGALNRVYLNIGMFSEDWVKHFIPFIGGAKITPIRIKVANEHSLYWQANVTQTPDVGLFFLAASTHDKLSAAPGGMKYLKPFDDPEVKEGARLFARNCAACHSSKLPEKAYSFFKKSDPTACIGKNYPGCWDAYWTYTKSPEFKNAMQEMVKDPTFLENNYLSTELRVPVNLTDSQLCSPIGTNAIAGNIWDNFSSASYKALESIGNFRVDYPTSNMGMASAMVQVPGGGRGYLRPASLISLWSTAPFLQNNALGKFDWRGTVDGRMNSFNDSIRKLLWPETRAEDAGHGKLAVDYVTTDGHKLKGVIDVTTTDSYLKVPRVGTAQWLWHALVDRLRKEPKGIEMMQKGKSWTMRDGSKMEKIVYKQPEPPKRNWIERQFHALFGGTDKTELASTSDEESANVTGDEAGEFLNIGPIPAGVPINLVSNINLELFTSLKRRESIFTLMLAFEKVIHAVAKIHLEHLQGTAARDAFMSIAGDQLIKVSKCKDFVVNRGHYFGTQYSPDKGDSGQGLSQTEKAALIEYLKWL